MSLLRKGMVLAVALLAFSYLEQGHAQEPDWMVGQLPTCPPPPRLPWEEDPPIVLKDEKPCGLWDSVSHDMELIGQDYRQCYCGPQVKALLLALAVTAPLANTDADQQIRNWYQWKVRSRQTDEWAQVGKVFGAHGITVPVALAALVLGNWYDDTPFGEVAHTWGSRTCRALAVGAPAVGVLQYGLGASRPGERHGSAWQPFLDKNSVAGHGFVGAVPFLAAASMTENRLLKGVFLAGSFWTSWSRINDDCHYFSQTVLGWTIAWVAVQSVVETDRQRLSFVPLLGPECSGMAALIRF